MCSSDLEKSNDYGAPLDSRNTYTKSDWLMWCAAMAEETQDGGKTVEAMAERILKFLEEDRKSVV